MNQKNYVFRSQAKKFIFNLTGVICFQINYGSYCGKLHDLIVHLELKIIGISKHGKCMNKMKGWIPLRGIKCAKVNFQH